MSSNNFILPAEWYKQEAIQLTWPHKGTDWAPYLDEVLPAFVRMAQEISRRQRLIIAAQKPDEVRTLLASHLTSQEQQQRVTIVGCPTDDTWARDHAFISLIDKQTGQRRLLDFGFNGWGEKFSHSNDNAINSRLYDLGIVSGEYADHNTFILEGGSIESDGNGTIMTTSQCLMDPHRNQPMTQEEITDYLIQTLHARRILYLDHGQLTGDDTDGHIDTLVRFASEDTLLYIRCTDSNHPDYQSLKAMEEQLKTLRTSEGKQYNLVALPMPDAMTYDDEILPATYANFVILNGAVLCPTYGQPEKDREAIEILSRSFPDREVVGIDASVIVRQHGSLHCLTMQYPDVIS